MLGSLTGLSAYCFLLASPSRLTSCVLSGASLSYGGPRPHFSGPALHNVSRTCTLRPQPRVKVSFRPSATSISFPHAPAIIRIWADALGPSTQREQENASNNNDLIWGQGAPYSTGGGLGPDEGSPVFTHGRRLIAQSLSLCPCPAALWGQPGGRVHPQGLSLTGSAAGRGWSRRGGLPPSRGGAQTHWSWFLAETTAGRRPSVLAPPLPQGTGSGSRDSTCTPERPWGPQRGRRAGV